MVKKEERKNFTHTVIVSQVIDLISEGYNIHDQIRSCLKISKERLQYHMKKMIDEGLITKYSRGLYDLTDAGKKFHVTYVESMGKDMIRLENMRWKYPIVRGGERIIQYYLKDPKKSQINGITQYHGKINNLSSNVKISKDHEWLEIISEKQIGKNCYELYHNAETQVEMVLKRLRKDPEISIGTGEPSMKPEWAFPHLFAEIGLTATQSSQIRTQYGIINKSKGRNADWEVDSIVKVERILNIPNEIDSIKDSLAKLLQIIPQLSGNNYRFL